MITSHAHQPLHSQNSTDSSLENMTSASAVVAAGQGTLDRSAGSAAPFSGDTADSPAQFEDDFDIPPINLPPSALEDQQNQHQPDYNNGASYQHYQHQNQHMYSQQQHHYQHPQQHTVGYFTTFCFKTLKSLIFTRKNSRVNTKILFFNQRGCKPHK